MPAEDPPSRARPARAPSRPHIPREELDEEPLDPRLQLELNRAHARWQWEFDQLRAAVPSLPPKPTQNDARSPQPSKPPPGTPKAHWLAHLAAALTSFAAVLAVVVTLVKALGELHTVPPGTATTQQVAESEARCLAKVQALAQNQLNFRNQVVGVWDLQGISTVDPPGAPARLPVKVLPPPLVGQGRRGASKIPAAPLIQVGEPIAVPPTFDTP